MYVIVNICDILKAVSLFHYVNYNNFYVTPALRSCLEIIKQPTAVEGLNSTQNSFQVLKSNRVNSVGLHTLKYDYNNLLLMEGEDKVNNYSQGIVLGEDLPKGEGQNKACKQSEQRIKFRGRYVPIAQIINKQVKAIIGTNEEMKMNSVSAFELFKAVYESKVTAVRLTEMSALQFEKFLKWVHPSHVTQPNLQKQYLSITKSLKLAIGSTIQFQLQPSQTSSVLSDFCQFSKLFLSLSDITVVINLGKWSKVQEWEASLQKLWKSFTSIKNIKIEIKGQWETINSSVVSSVRSLLFGGLACLTEISHLSFYQICFTSIGTNDYIAIQQNLRTVFQKNKITSLHLESCSEFPIFRELSTLQEIKLSNSSFKLIKYINKIIQNNPFLWSIQLDAIVQQLMIEDVLFDRLEALIIYCNGLLYQACDNVNLSIRTRLPSKLKCLKLQSSRSVTEQSLRTIFPKLVDVRCLLLNGVSFQHRLLNLIPSSNLQELHMSSNVIKSQNLKVIASKWKKLKHLSVVLKFGGVIQVDEEISGLIKKGIKLNISCYNEQ